MRQPKKERKWDALADRLAPLVVGQKYVCPFDRTAQNMAYKIGTRFKRKFITRRIGDSLEITRVEKMEES